MPTPGEILTEQLELTRSLQKSLSNYIRFLRRAYREMEAVDRLVDMDSTEKVLVKDKAILLRDDVKTKAAAL